MAESEDEAFIAELLQHLGHSTVKEVVEEALREYVGDGDGADWLILDTFTNEVAAKAWEKGYTAGWADTSLAIRTPNPYREEGAS